MLVPSCFHGLLKDVKKETKKVARKLLKGQSLDEAFGAYEMLDTKNYPNSIFYIERTVFSLKYILCKMNVAPEKLSEIHDTIDLEELVKDYDLLNCDISMLSWS